MKVRRRTKTCPNCQARLADVYNYCPMCGQENTHINVSLRTLLKDFFDSYFSLDSRLWRTLPRFLFRPGHITNAFMAGQRMRYMHPLRLYLVVSIVFFFALTRSLGGAITLEKMGRDVDNLRFSGTPVLDSIQHVQDSLTEVARQQAGAVFDSLGLPADSVFSMADSVLENVELPRNTMMSLLRSSTLTDKEVLDSLGVDSASVWEYRSMRQLRRIAKKDLDVFVPFVIGNLPLMLLLLLIPLFALMLRLLYVRHKHIRYIHHLIHTLHIHAFSFVVYSLAALLLLALAPTSTDFRLYVMVIALLVVTVYSLLSFKNFYRQTWALTLIKFFMVGWGYSFLLFFGVMGAFMGSFFLF